MVWLYIIWGFLALMFLALGCFQWKKAGKSILHLQIKQQTPEGVKFQVEMAGIDFIEFVGKFNSYIDYYNKLSKKQNQVQAYGYWGACATAIFSLVITAVS
jgi:hypothetical protein